MARAGLRGGRTRRHVYAHQMPVSDYAIRADTLWVPRGGARLAVARAGAAAALAPTIPYVSRHGRGAQRFAG